jgi:hypothetical protein
MLKNFFFFLLISVTAAAQSYKTDTLQNAAAYINSFSILPFRGTANNGDTYVAGFNEHYDENGKAQDVELVRIALATKNIQYKKLNGVLSGKGFYWIYVFDRQGNIYLSMNTGGRKIIRVNCKDSIAYTDLGNAFINGTTLAYSASVGTDGNLYFGGSSGGTYWSMYNVTTQKFEKHPRVDSLNDYVLSIGGDTDFVYLQIGQRRAIDLWAVNKRTEEKKKLFSITNTSRFSFGVYSDGIYAGLATDTLQGTFKLVHGRAVKVIRVPATSVEQSGRTELTTAKSRDVMSVYDPVRSLLFFSYDKKNFDSIPVKSYSFRTDIRRIFSFPNDPDNIYYAGDYYGNYYRYNLKEQRSYLLGSTGYNVYSFLQENDSMIYMSGYPSGYIMLWNRNKPWTLQKFMHGKNTDGKDSWANPRLLRFWKSEGKPMAGFHHTFQMVKDAKGNIIGAGDVIRINNAASIGVYDPRTNSVYGINYEPYTSFKFAGIAVWDDHIIYSMKATGNKKPKLYFYQPEKNTMTDSVYLGFDDYGKIFIQNNELTGFANNRIYRYDLKQRRLLFNYSFQNNSIIQSYRLQNGRYIINTRSKIPNELSNAITLPYDNYFEANNVLYTIRGKYILQIKPQ